MDEIDRLRLELDQVRASRARLVAAADGELRRIERALHDCVQQQLVAIAVNVQLARQAADSGDAALLEEIAGDVHDALAASRSLANEVYPSLLLGRGLADALRGAAAQAAVPTRVETSTAGRCPPAVESTVFRCCTDAIEAAGDGSAATVRVRDEADAIAFEVEVRGLAELELSAGSLDRIEALGGRLSISSDGTTARVAGTVPLRG